MGRAIGVQFMTAWSRSGDIVAAKASGHLLLDEWLAKVWEVKGLASAR